MKFEEAKELTKAVIYEYISIPLEIVKKYSKDVFDKKPNNYHITTSFKPINPLKKYYGEKIKFKIVAYGKSDVAEAVKVELINKPNWLNCKGNLHITLTFKNKPVDSNYIEDWETVNDSKVYEGEFKGFTN